MSVSDIPTQTFLPRSTGCGHSDLKVVNVQITKHIDLKICHCNNDKYILSFEKNWNWNLSHFSSQRMGNVTEVPEKCEENRENPVPINKDHMSPCCNTKRPVVLLRILIRNANLKLVSVQITKHIGFKISLCNDDKYFLPFWMKLELEKFSKNGKCN